MRILEVRYSKNMQFVHAEASAGVHALAAHIGTLLDQGEHVLWLVSGGSNIPWTVAVMEALSPASTVQLTIMPVDERYGPTGHPDSNVAQLLNAGLNLKYAQLLPILAGESLDASTDAFDKVAKIAFAQHTAVVAQLGIGTDGHIAGILPGSPAILADLTQLAVGYTADDYIRITLTFGALRHIDTAFVFAYGAAKRATLEQLRTQNLPLARQPSQILKQLPEAYIYNDQMKEGMHL